MGHSLINPNQLQAYGVTVNDNPYDRNNQLGIVLDDGDHIPFQSKGTAVYFETSYPSKHDMESLPHIILTDGKEWNPHKFLMPGGEGYDDTNLSHEIFINRASSSKHHHFLYETDAIMMSQFQITNQSMDESIIRSVQAVSITEVKSQVLHSKYTPEHVASLFDVPIEGANNILFTSTQRNICQGVYPLTRRYAIHNLILSFHALGGKWMLDFLVLMVKSIRQHVEVFLFSNGSFVAAYPAMSCNDANSTEALRQFTNNIGVPARLRFDMARGFVGKHTSFQSLISKLQVDTTNSEPGRHNQLQQVDVAIYDFKRCWHHSMSTKNIPKRLWCFGLEYQAKLI